MSIRLHPIDVHFELTEVAEGRLAAADSVACALWRRATGNPLWAPPPDAAEAVAVLRRADLCVASSF